MGRRKTKDGKQKKQRQMSEDERRSTLQGGVPIRKGTIISGMVSQSVVITRDLPSKVGSGKIFRNSIRWPRIRAERTLTSIFVRGDSTFRILNRCRQLDWTTRKRITGLLVGPPASPVAKLLPARNAAHSAAGGRAGTTTKLYRRRGDRGTKVGRAHAPHDIRFSLRT